MKICFASIFAFLFSICLNTQTFAATWNDGDLFLLAGNGNLTVLDGLTFAVKDQIAGAASGSGEFQFSPSGDLYITSSNDSTIRVFDGADPHSLLMTIDAANPPSPTIPALNQVKAISFDADGNFYVVDGTGTAINAHQYDSNGNFIAQFGLPVFPGNGVISLDLLADQTTFAYISPNNPVLKNSVGGPATDLLTLGGHFLISVRSLPPGDGSGGYLIARQGASSSFAKDIVHVEAGAAPVLKSFDDVSQDNWQGISITADGNSFWASNLNKLYRFNVASGAIEVGPIDASLFVHRMIVKGEYRAGLDVQSDVDLAQSSLSVDPQVISSFAGVTTLTVSLVDQALNPLPGITGLALQASSGALLGDVVDNGDGTYSQDFEAAPGSATVTLSATVDGDSLLQTASVSLVPIDADLSTLSANPESVYLGGIAMIQVSPVDDQNTSVGSGANVVISSSIGNLVGSVVDNGDGTYSQAIQATTLGTADISATVDDLALNTTASLTVEDPASLGSVFGLNLLDEEISYTTIQEAVNNATADQLSVIYISPGIYDEVVLIKNASSLRIEALSATEPVVLDGIRLRSSSNIELVNLEVNATNSARRYGIRLQGRWRSNQDVRIIGSEVYGASKHGIIVAPQNSNTSIEDSHSHDNAYNGIRLAHDSGPTQVVNSIISSNQRNGIRIGRNATATLSLNTISMNGRYGVSVARQLSADPTWITLIQNILSSNNGRIIGTRADNDLKNFPQFIDGTDDQSPYTP